MIDKYNIIIEKMLTGRQKIVKAGGAQPDELESQVAQELLNLEVRENRKKEEEIECEDQIERVMIWLRGQNNIVLMIWLSRVT